jgi:hypothetical protein
VVNAEVTPLQVFSQLGHDAGEDQVLGKRVQSGDIDDVHATILEAAPRQIVGDTVIGDEALRPRADIAEAVPNLADRGHVMSSPHLRSTAHRLHEIEDGPEELVEIGEALYLERLAAQHLIDVLPSYHSLGQKIDKRIRLRVYVVPVEHDLGIVQHLSQAPDQRLGICRQGLVGPQAVQIHTIRFQRCVVAYVFEGLGTKAQSRVLT